MTFLYIAIGGAVGALSRHFVSGITHQVTGSLFPVGTLAVNSLGCLIFGFIWGMSERYIIPPDTRAFIFIGVLGGFTTFSAFGFETLNLLRDNQFKLAALNILLNNILGITLVFSGLFLAKYFLEPK